MFHKLPEVVCLLAIYNEFYPNLDFADLVFNT